MSAWPEKVKAQYARWFNESRAFDGVGKTHRAKREIAADIEPIAKHFEQRAESDAERLFVEWHPWSKNPDETGGPDIRPCWGIASGEQILEGHQAPNRSESVGEAEKRWNETFYNLVADAPSCVSFLEREGIRLPNGESATPEGRLLLWSIYVSERDAPTSHNSYFEGARDGTFKVIAKALRILQRELRSDARKQEAEKEPGEPPSGPKGVTLFDASLVFECPEECDNGEPLDPELRNVAFARKVRWGKRETIRRQILPRIGEDPNDAQADLFDTVRVAKALANDKQVGPQIEANIGYNEFLRILRKRERPPAPTTEGTARTTVRTARVLKNSEKKSKAVPRGKSRSKPLAGRAQPRS